MHARRLLLVATLSGGLCGALVASLVSYANGRPATGPAPRGAAGLVTTVAVTTARPVAAAGVSPVEAVLAKVSPSVVAIEVRTASDALAGSGVIISADGLIVTNAHVVSGASTITIRYSNGETHEADLVGSSAKQDIALVRQRGAQGLPPAVLGDSSSLRVGQDVVAIGNAFDLGTTPTVTRGIVSATGRSLDTGETVLTDLLQTDAAINHGNSGGPLVDMSGAVIGINTAGIPNSHDVGFAIEINAVKPLISSLQAGRGDVQMVAYLGVATLAVGELDAPDRVNYGVTAAAGAVVTTVTSGSPAKDAGLVEGDVIVGIDGITIDGPGAVRAVLGGRKPTDRVEVFVQRRGATEPIEVTLGSRPAPVG